ncbi:helix-turn-helix transcriptional regulator [Rahnella woolbedingensis]|uniref:LuxR family transcriptional regulator n=1 Tax=Rahnella woolbedingensis TaxID=1510574 RepID=A0A419NE34_9GAMM|nr:LuxR C-terminal-related transcriptional regulator [Rahnella woolbedingensis]RJT46824.1 LuxR family transcriptional regulator [Rahnella woolbedingensis]
MANILIFSRNLFLANALNALCCQIKNSESSNVIICHSYRKMISEIKDVDYLIYDDEDGLWLTIRKFLFIRGVNPNVRLLSMKNGLECDFHHLYRSAKSDGKNFKKMEVDVIKERLISVLWRNKSGCQKDDFVSDNEIEWLTASENRVLKYILKGYKNNEISNHLSINEKSVSLHRRNIYKKTNVRNVTSLWKVFIQAE